MIRSKCFIFINSHKKYTRVLNFLLISIFLLQFIFTINVVNGSSQEVPRIFGCVFDNSTNETISELTIFVTNDDFYYGKTDINGFYEISLKHSGDYKLNVYLDGYYSYETVFSVQQNQNFELNISLKPLPQETSILKGYISNSDTRELIKNWKVFVSGENYYNETKTNKTGYYQINVSPGNYWVSVNGGDLYFNENIEFKILENDVKKMNLTLNPLPERVTKVYGYIIDNYTNEPIPGLNVIISEEKHSSKTITDNTGYYSIDIWKGQFLLWIYSEEYIDYECLINLDNKDFLIQNISLNSKQPVPIIDIFPNKNKFFTSEIIQFNGNSSKDFDGVIVNYTWNFGDGTSDLGETREHKFDSEGIYKVTLNVTDNDGRFRSTKIEINIEKKGEPNNDEIELSIKYIIVIILLILVFVIILIYKKQQQGKGKKSTEIPIKKSIKKVKSKKKKQKHKSRKKKKPTIKVEKKKKKRTKGIDDKTFSNKDKGTSEKVLKWEDDDEDVIEWEQDD